MAVTLQLHETLDPARHSGVASVYPPVGGFTLQNLAFAAFHGKGSCAGRCGGVAARVAAS